VVATTVAYVLPALYRIAPGDPRERIARAAADLVRPGAVVGFNGSTTTAAIARHLGQRADLRSSARETITVGTNALNIANDLVLRPDIRTACIGGVARPESYERHGPFASRVLQDLLHHLFLGVNAISAEEGASCQHLGESSISAEMVSRAHRVTVVADSQQIGVVALARICTIDQVDGLVADDAADPDQVRRLRDAGVDVTLV
jgi:DeoR family transcriptional regulator, aga operon transcriptional repressor